jgi:hypothetical protein
MLKKLCILVVGVVCCFGVVGCSDNKPVEPRKDKVEKPAEKPTNQTKEVEVPA